MKSRSRKIWPRFVIKKCKFFAIYEILNLCHVYYVVEIKEAFRILVNKVAYIKVSWFCQFSNYKRSKNNPNLALFYALNILNLKLVSSRYKTFHIISDYMTTRSIGYINSGTFEYSCHVTIGCISYGDGRGSVVYYTS